VYIRKPIAFIPKAERQLEEPYFSATRQLAEICQRLDDIGKAIQLCNAARQNGDVTAACQLGNLYQTQCQPQKAEELWEEARHAGHAVATHNLAVNYWERGQKVKALELWQEADRNGLQNAQLSGFSPHLLPQLSMPASRKNAATFTMGDLVKIHGLSSTSGRVLNGQIGVVVFIDLQIERYGVKVVDSDRLKVKAIHSKNLTTVVSQAVVLDEAASSNLATNKLFEIGDLVYIHSLTSDAASLLNGCKGQIKNFIARTGRFGVHVLGGHGVKAIRPDNLKIIGQGYSMTPGHESNPAEHAATVEEFSTQAVVEGSSHEAHVSQDSGAIKPQSQNI
jgi:tetratricopeptide (TPR) repeat protein